MQSLFVMDAGTTVAQDIILVTSGEISPHTITVNASGGADYTRIQDAMDNASAGDTILVYSGTYYENVDVNKQLILFGVDNGGGMPVVDANGSGSAIKLSADGITLEGFTAIGASSHAEAGIMVTSNSNILSGNNASNNNVGIYLAHSNNNTIIGNNVSNNSFGISLYFSSNYNRLSGNIASNNSLGIFLYSSSNYNVLNGNNANSNTYAGIHLDSSGNNNISGNNASNNGYGIFLQSSSNNTLSGNIANSNNNYYGIFMYSSSNNTIYNNYFNNTNNFGFFGTNSNKWNIPKTPGTNVIGGSYLGGNFWANPNGTGFSQTCADNDSDGICDSPYALDSNNIDYLPLAYKAAPGGNIAVEIINPTTDSSFLQGEMILLSCNVSGGTAPYNCNWTSSIDGFIGNSSRIFTFSLSPGTHTITLNVLDANGLTNSTSTTITVNRASTTNITGQSATGTMTWNASNFPVFANENLNVASLTDRTIGLDGLVYMTSGQAKLLKIVENGVSDGSDGGPGSNGLLGFGAGEMSGIQGAYNIVSFFGRPYVGIKNHSYEPTKLLLEQNDTESKTLAVGETWDMGDGYSLKLNLVDIGALPYQAWLTLYKSGTILDDKVIANGSVYTYVATNIGGEYNVPMFVTYVDNVSASNIRLKYTWLISDNIIELTGGDMIGLLRVVSTEPLVLENTEDAITLSQGSAINISDGLRFRVNNTPALQYYPEMTVITIPPTGAPVESSTGKGTVIVNTDMGTIENLTAVNVSDIPEPPPVGANLYYGLFRFNITGLSLGGIANITLKFPDNLPAGTTYWKYGANATNTTPHWYTIPSAVNGNKLAFTLTDGGNGDDDLTANGRIRDDSGPSIPQPALPVHNLNTGENFSTIQAAIDDADTLNGHTITVDSGTHIMRMWM